MFTNYLKWWDEHWYLIPIILVLVLVYLYVTSWIDTKRRNYKK